MQLKENTCLEVQLIFSSLTIFWACDVHTYLTISISLTAFTEDILEIIDGANL